jgi:quercetin dioxygenase-like cupin family protein
MMPIDILAKVPALALTILAGSMTSVASDEIDVRNLDAIVKSSPLTSGGATASIVGSIRAGDAEIGVLVMSKNRLHHHSHQDHVLYLERGNGIARLETATGQVETRAIRPGDILSLPRGKKHGFEKSGDQDLVFLVVATPLPPGVEETTYHE